MTPEAITALAHEYAEEIYPHEEGEDLGQMEFLRTSAAKHIKASLKMLSRRFCLVEKSKVEEVYKSTKSYKSELEPFSRQSDCCSVKLRLLESLFTEIAKEVEG